MALNLHVTLTLALLHASSAIRGQSPDDKGSVSGDDVSICGDDDIWEDVTSPKDPSAIKAIDWKGIDERMKGYVDNHQHLVKTSDGVIKNLRKRIEEKKAKATSRPIEDTEIEDLVEKSVSHGTSFESSEAAKATRCGKPGFKFQNKKPSQAAFENSKTVMSEVADQFFHAGVKSEVGQFTTVCLDYLGFQRTGDAVKDDLESYCDELCADLAEAVQQISNTVAAGSMRSVKKLEAELAREEQKKEKLYAKQKLCENYITRIHNFHSYMVRLADDTTLKHQAIRKAEWALDDAQDIFEDLTSKLLEQQTTMDKAKAGLTDLGLAASEANSDLDMATAKFSDVTGKLQKADEEWKGLLADLADIKAAEKYSDEVKQRLSLLLLKMDGYMEECVREPVRNIGLSEETKVYDGEFFTWDVTTLPAKGDMNNALTAFHNYCETTAKGIFAMVKDTVDLSPLCKLQPQEETLQEIVSTIQDRKNSVVESITGVQSWLDPFKGTDVTKETEMPNFVQEGEPLGLRRVMSTGLEEFYSNYLKKWKKNGEFLQLLASITVLTDDLSQKLEKAAAALDEATREAQEAQNQVETATASFRKAVEAAELEKQELTDVVSNLEEQVNAARLNLDDLKAKVEEAKKQWVLSKVTLVTKHAISKMLLVAQHEGDSSLAEKSAAISKLD